MSNISLYSTYTSNLNAINSMFASSNTSKTNSLFTVSSNKPIDDSSKDLSSILASSLKTDTTSAKALSNYTSSLKTSSKAMLSSIDKLKKGTTTPEDKISTVETIVADYNKLLDAAGKFKDSGSTRFADRLASIGTTYNRQLKEIGISIDTNGKLNVDSKSLKKATEDGKLDNFLSTNSTGGPSYGFISKLDALMTQTNEDPTYFVSASGKATSAVKNSIFSASNNYIRQVVRYSNAGSLFDAMF